jgi:hypothetical protein
VIAGDRLDPDRTGQAVRSRSVAVVVGTYRQDRSSELRRVSVAPHLTDVDPEQGVVEFLQAQVRRPQSDPGAEVVQFAPDHPTTLVFPEGEYLKGLAVLKQG